jgi:small subunit ribosomal protein S20
LDIDPLKERFTPAEGPFVYRLGRKIFILERGVRFPYGLPKINKKQIYVNKMANHKSSEKRIRQTKVRRLTNRYASRTTRGQVRKLRTTTSKEDAQKLYPEVCSMLDKLAKKKVIHQNKANNLKSKLAAHVNSLS